jgi:hypothetical protein
LSKKALKGNNNFEIQSLVIYWQNSISDLLK